MLNIIHHHLSLNKALLSFLAGVGTTHRNHWVKGASFPMTLGPPSTHIPNDQGSESEAFPSLPSTILAPNRSPEVRKTYMFAGFGYG